MTNILSADNPLLKKYGHWCLLILIGLLAYSNSLTNNFMLDDHIVLFGEKGVENKTFATLFQAHQSDFYRPVGHVLLLCFYSLFTTNAVAYHWANLILFLIIVILFYKIVQLLTGDDHVALLTALIYCLHPINAMLVNYITANIISTFVITQQISMICFLYFLKDPNKKYLYLFSLLFFVFALFSHEMSIIFPFYLLCAVYFLQKDQLKEKVLLCLPYIMIAAVYFSFRLKFFSLRGSIEGTSVFLSHPGVYLAFVTDLLEWYVKKLFWPQDIVFLWTGTLYDQWVHLNLIKLAAVVLIVLFGIFLHWRKGIKAFALAIFAAGLLPTGLAAFTYFPFSDPIIEPHWFYFSSIGFFILIAVWFTELKTKMQHKSWWAFLICGLITYLFLLIVYNGCWKNQETYCRHWLALNQKNMTPFYGLGKSLLEKGNPQEAVEYFEKGLKAVKYPSVHAFADLGYASFLSGNKEKARKYYRAAFKLDPTYSLTYHYWGQLYLQEGQFAEAEKAYLQANLLYPKNKDYRKYLSMIQNRR